MTTEHEDTLATIKALLEQCKKHYEETQKHSDLLKNVQDHMLAMRKELADNTATVNTISTNVKEITEFRRTYEKRVTRIERLMFKMTEVYPSVKDILQSVDHELNL